MAKQLDLFRGDSSWPKLFACSGESFCNGLGHIKDCCQGCHREGYGLVYEDLFYCCAYHPDVTDDSSRLALLSKLVHKEDGSRIFG